MPVHRGKDSKGSFYQWGGEGKKYHYTSGNKSSRDAAKKKAERQVKPPGPAVTTGEPARDAVAKWTSTLLNATRGAVVCRLWPLPPHLNRS
jgi:hypothetical protein